MQRRGRAIATILATAGLMLAAASTPARAAEPGGGGGAPLVVASIAPVHALLSGVMEGAGRPRLLLDAGVSPHDYQMKPSDARVLARAAAVFWIGPAIEAFMAKPVRGLPKSVFAVELAGVDGVRQRQNASGGGRDPHVWLDPVNAAAMVRTMVIVLANVDPERLVLYRKNGARVLAGLGRLDAELRGVLAPVAGRPFLVYHDAYGHLARAFGLALLGAVTAEAERAPGARRVAELRRTIVEKGVGCLFTEPPPTPPLAKRLVEGTAARIVALDVLGSGLEPGPGLYGETMRRLAGAMAGCLKGR